MKERIEAIIQHERLSPSQFADALGVQRSGISHILSGRNKPSLDFLNKLLNQFPHISGDWLITGMGAMLKGSTQNENKAPEQLQFPATESSIRKPLKVPQKSVKEEDKPVYQTPPPKKDPNPILSAFSQGKAVERIVVFYQDQTFREYRPE